MVHINPNLKEAEKFKEWYASKNDYFIFIFLSTKINIATNLIFRLITITNACLLDSSSLSKFMDSKQLTFTNLIEKSLSEFQVNVICTFHSL